jgi:hypothetical protein
MPTTQYFDPQVTLPHTDCTEENFYELCRTLKPRTDMVDGTSLKFDATTGKIQAGDSTPYFRKFTKTAANLSQAATTFDIELFQLPAGGVIHAIKLKHSAAFAGGALSAYTLSIGLATNLTRYMAAKSVFAAPSATAFHIVWAPFFNYLNVALTFSASYNQTELNNFKNAYQALFTGSIGSEDHGSAQSVRLAAASTGGNLSLATTGSVDVWVLYSILT